MAENRTGGRFVEGILQNLGASFVISIGAAVWQKVRNGSVDWWAIGALFILAGAVFWALIYFFRRNQGKSHSLPPENADPLKAELQKLKDDLTESADLNLEYRAKLAELQDASKETGKKLEMFTPLQLEAFQLARDLRSFLREIGPRPTIDASTFPSTTNGLAQSIVARFNLQSPWLQKLTSGYELKFAQRVKTVRLKFGECGLSGAGELDSWTGSVTTEIEIQLCWQTLDRLAIRLNAPDVPAYSRAEIDRMPADTLRFRMENEPGFTELVNYYASNKVRLLL